VASEASKWRPERVVCVGFPVTRDWLLRVLNPPSEQASGLAKIDVEMLATENEFSSLTYESIYRSLQSHYQISPLRYWMAVFGRFDPDAVARVAVVWDEAIFPKFPHIAKILSELKNSGAITPFWRRQNCFVIFPLTFVVLSTASKATEPEEVYFRLGADIVVDPAEEPDWILLDRIQTRAQRLNRLQDQLRFSRLVRTGLLFFVCTVLGSMLAELAKAIVFPEKPVQVVIQSPAGSATTNSAPPANLRVEDKTTNQSVSGAANREQ
jgi:hypothetical protein